MYSSGPHARLSQRVLADSACLTPTNTGKAYAPKKKEFEDFCKAIHADKEASIRFTVTEEKLFSFLYFQANRKCRKNGAKKRKAQEEEDDEDDYNFDVAEYDEVIRRGERNLPHSHKKLQYDTVNQYYCAVLELWKTQQSNGSNNISKDMLRSDRVMK
jgi:hypothetical protein